MRQKRGAIAGATIDSQRLAEIVRMPGIDPRLWISAGTVGTRDDDGEFVTDVLVAPESGPDVPDSVYVDDRGAVVDVRLEPSGDVVTAQWSGVGVGEFGSILFPVRGGDSVLVLIPDGDLNSPDISIVAVLSSATRKVPRDWNNDRVLFNLNVPLEIRGPAVSIRSNNLRLNGRAVAASNEGI